MAKEEAEEKKVLLRFATEGRLWEAVRLLSGLGYGGARGCVYRLCAGDFMLYLLLPRGRCRFAVLIGILEEYGQREENPAALAYLREYGECLFPEQPLRKMIAARSE